MISVTRVDPTQRLWWFGPAARTRHLIRTLAGLATPTASARGAGHHSSDRQVMSVTGIGTGLAPAAGFGRDARLAARTHYPNRILDPATDQRPGEGGTKVGKAEPEQGGQAMDRWLA
jgi:hypothetical protein